MSALWQYVMFVQILHVCENVRAGRRGFEDLQLVYRSSQTNKLNIDTQKHMYIIVRSYPKSWNQVTMMSWPCSKLCSSVYCSLLTGLSTQISPCSVWLTHFRLMFLVCWPSCPQTLANGACTALHPLPLHLPRALHHLTVSVSLHLMWHLCDVMVNTSPHVVLPLCPLLQDLHVWFSYSLHRERSSLFLSAKFWLLLVNLACGSLCDTSLPPLHSQTLPPFCYFATS